MIYIIGAHLVSGCFLVKFVFVCLLLFIRNLFLVSLFLMGGGGLSLD